MNIDVSFLPALAAAFLLTFARVGTMVMLLPGVGELNLPSRVRLAIALVLTAIVITLAMTAFVLALAHRAWQLGRDDLLEDDEESARIHRRAEENDMSGESRDDADVIAAEFAEEDD